jgi:ubiquinone/menaquinone biosynthesis C-methylase UbiE
MEAAIAPKSKPYKGMAMEGMLATWYARNTAKSLAEFRDCAKRIAAGLVPGGWVLEIAPGPGYLAIELARLGAYRITGVDISRSFVRIAAANAAHAGVDVDFRHGDAASLPFAADTFDFIVCRAAFKNFGDPVGALCEMHRVMRPGGRALVIDLRRDAPSGAIADEVAKMRLGRLDALVTRTILSSLRKRAYTRGDFARLLSVTPFKGAEIDEEPMALEIRLVK